MEKTSIPMKTVIVVEDDPLNRELAGELLFAEGFDVLEAQHSADALVLFDKHSALISVMFTDIDMPGTMNGLELAHHVRKHWPWVALLITSGKRKPPQADLPTLSRFMDKPYGVTIMLQHVKDLSILMPPIFQVSEATSLLTIKPLPLLP